MKSILELIYNDEFDVNNHKIEPADLIIVDKEGDDALHFSVLKKNEEIVKLLIKNDCNVNTLNKNGKSALHLAADMNLLEIAKILIEKKADLGISDIYGNQPLWTAVFNAADGKLNKLSIVELFIKNGADKYHKNHAGRSPLDFAKQVNFLPLLEVLGNY
jgi:ankyrin repeat protein